METVGILCDENLMFCLSKDRVGLGFGVLSWSHHNRQIYESIKEVVEARARVSMLGEVTRRPVKLSSL